MIINNAIDLNDLRVPPGNRLESLSGDRTVSTAFVSTTSGESASSGTMATPTRWR